VGGNKKSSDRTYLNLFTVMFLGGLWHGASWNFVIWGVLHGAYLTIHKIISDKFPHLKIHPFFKSKIGKLISILITQYFVFLAWIPFRVGNTEHMLYSMQKYIFIDFQSDEILTFILSHKWPVLIMGIFVILHIFIYFKPNIITQISKMKLKYWTVFLTIVLFTIVYFFNGNSQDFIYFRF
jgi:hypothetical protein